jgi:hypothetical protein
LALGPNPLVLSYRYDENGNGLWSISEFNTYEANFKSEATFGMVDRSRGGAISKSEFVVFFRASSTFEKYATKETGTITQDSWKKYANDYGINCTVSFVDTSRNGAISRLEFYVSLDTAACQPNAKARFAQMDADSDGVWSPEEYEAYSTKFAGCSTPTDTPCAFSVANRKKNGKISLEEFSYATDSYTQFSEFDEDGDLKLTEDQFKAYKAKYPGTRRQTGSDFAKIDKDKSGYCDYCNEVLKGPDSDSEQPGPNTERCGTNCKIGLGVGLGVGIPAGLMFCCSVWWCLKCCTKPPVMPQAIYVEEKPKSQLVFYSPPPVVSVPVTPLKTKTTLKHMTTWVNTAVPKWELRDSVTPVTEIDYEGAYHEPHGYIASSPVPVPTSPMPHGYIASSIPTALRMTNEHDSGYEFSNGYIASPIPTARSGYEFSNGYIASPIPTALPRVFPGP